MEENQAGSENTLSAYPELETGLLSALETYSNVHRGSGQFSQVTTALYEYAREIVIEHLGVSKRIYEVIFCSPAGSALLCRQLKHGNFHLLTSSEIGLSIGVHAVVAKRHALHSTPTQMSGGGTTRLVSKTWVHWAGLPDRFEAGTPSILNVICFARALRLMGKSNSLMIGDNANNIPSVKELLYHDELDSFSGKELLLQLKNSITGKDVLVPTKAGFTPLINLDNSASTPAFGPVWKTYCQALRLSAEERKQVITEVKSICAEFLGASKENYDIIFTSNTTEAINLAAEAFGSENKAGIEPVVVNTIMEHSSNDLPWRFIRGTSLLRISVNDEGFIDLNALDLILRDYNELEKYGRKRIRLLAFSGASNVLGICSDLRKIGEIAHKYGARILVDAAQLVAHRKVSLEAWGIDYLAFSAHKLYAPFGSGALVVRKGLLRQHPDDLKRWIDSGEENTAGIAALGKAMVLLQRVGMDLVSEEEKLLTAKALTGMSKIPGLRIYGVQDPFSPSFEDKVGVIVFSLKRMMPNQLVRELAERRGIGARYGCHCAHIIIKHLLGVSPALERLQKFMLTLFPAIRLPGLSRISIGLGNKEEDIDALMQVLQEIAVKPLSGRYKSPGSSSKSDLKRHLNEFTAQSISKVYSV